MAAHRGGAVRAVFYINKVCYLFGISRAGVANRKAGLGSGINTHRTF